MPGYHGYCVLFRSFFISFILTQLQDTQYLIGLHKNENIICFAYVFFLSFFSLQMNFLTPWFIYLSGKTMKDSGMFDENKQKQIISFGSSRAGFQTHFHTRATFEPKKASQAAWRGKNVSVGCNRRLKVPLYYKKQ